MTKSFLVFFTLFMGGNVVLFSFQNCGRAKMGFVGEQASLGLNGGQGLPASCPAGQVAIGLAASRDLLCVPTVTTAGTICPSDSYLYEYNSNGQAVCVKNSERDPTAGLCDHNREVEVYDAATGVITCMRMPGVRPNYNCPPGEWVLGTWNGVLTCSGSGGPTPTPPQTGGPNYVCPTGQYISSITNGVLVCKDILIPVPNPLQCAANQAIVGLAGGNVICQDLMPSPHPESVCPAGQFAQSQSANQVNCISEPEKDLVMYCPKGKYLTSFSSTGYACQNLPAGDPKFNGSCTAGQVLLGFANGQPVCRNLTTPEVTHMCPSGTYLNQIIGSIYICIPFDDKNPCRPGFELDGGVCVDRTPPVITVTKAPQSGPARAAQIEFTVSDLHSPIESVLCALDGGSAAACSSPVALANLPLGFHRLLIKATDKAGNSAWKGVEWTVTDPGPVPCDPGYTRVGEQCLDKSPPVITITQRPQNGGSTSAVTAFTVVDQISGVKTVTCKIDGGAFAPCSSPLNQANLKYGFHEITIQAEDNAGNKSSKYIEWTISKVICPEGFVLENGNCVDKTAPVVKIILGPGPITQDRGGNVVFTVTDGGSGVDKIECSVDGGNFAVCASPKNVANLNPGPHNVKVRAFDKSGNRGEAVHSWAITFCNPGSKVSCPVDNGTGEMSCKADGSGYGSCGPTACNPGYELKNGVCVKTDVGGGDDPVCKRADNKTFFVPKWTPLESRLPKSCEQGVEMWNIKAGKSVTLKATRAGGCYADHELEFDYATYRAANKFRVFAILKNGSKKVIFEPCMISTHVDIEGKCMPNGAGTRPIEDSIRDFRVKVPRDTVELKFEPLDNNTPWYLRVRGLCNFDLNSPKFTSPLRWPEKYKVIGNDEKECRVTFDTGGYWSKHVKSNHDCEKFRDEIKWKYPHKRRNNVRCGNDQLGN